MNKNFHRIIFNAARGVRMVVQETARSAGKASGATPAAMGAALAALLAVPLAQSQIAADPGAPGGQRATIVTAPNGVPLVNIQTPSAAGVSRNVYRQFDVNAQGAILNNSRSTVQTQLGGYVQGNPWLARGGARVILNEVNSSHPSQLRGYVEVAGPRAEVIIANPAGIQVDGGGFINTSRATLTTGAPQFNAQGHLESFLVRGGAVGVQGAGLDASRTDYAAILARAVAVNAGIWAAELKVVTGANQVSADAGQVAPIAPATVSGAAPAFALDVAHLGGMYANKIALIGTEAGVGVRNAGHIGAGAGGLVVTAAGRLENTGTLEGSRLDIASAGDIVNRGTVRQAGSAALTIAAPVLENTGGGTIGAEPVVADAGGTGVAGGSGTSTGSAPAGTGTVPSAPGTPAVAAPGAEASDAAPVAPPEPGLLRAAGALRNEGGHIYAGGPIHLQTPQVDNAGGTLDVASLAVAGPRFSNAGGVLTVQQGFSADVDTFDNTGGRLQAAGLDIRSRGDLRNQGGMLATQGDATLVLGGELDNTDGRITAGRHTTITAAGVASGGTGLLGAGIQADGSVGAAGDLRVTSAGLLQAEGTLVAASDMALQAARIDLSGSRASAAAIALTATQGDLVTRGATVATPGTLAIHADAQGTQTLVNDAGMLNAGRLELSASNIANTHGGQIVQTGVDALRIAAQGTLDNTGGVIASDSQGLSLAADRIVNTDGTVRHTGGGTLAIDAGSVSGAGGSLIAHAALDVHVRGEFDQAGGSLSAERLSIEAGSLNNQRGSIVQTGHAATRIQVAETLDNDAGRMASNGDGLSLQAATLRNGKGVIEHAGAGILAITVAEHRGALGQIVTAGTLAVQATGAFDQDGGTLSADHLQIDAGAWSNRGATMTQTGSEATRIAVAGNFANDGGTLASNGREVALAAGTLSNGAGGKITAAGALTVHATGAFNQDSGTTRAGRIEIEAGSLSNREGLIEQVGDEASRIAVAGTLDNGGGLIVSNGKDLSLSAGTLVNEAGTVRHAGVGTGVLAIDVGSLRGARGSLASKGALALRAGSVDHDGASLQASQIGIDAEALSNRGGQIVQTGAGTARLHVAGMLDNGGGLIGTAINTGAAIDLDVQGLANQGGRMVADGDLRVQSTADLRNDGGAMHAGGSVDLKAAGLLGNAHGSIEAAADDASLVLQAGTIDNTDGRIANAGQGRTALTAATVTNASTVVAADGSSGFIAGNGSVAIAATTLQNLAGGTLNAGGALQLAVTERVVNRATMASSGTLDFVQADATLDNTAGQITAAGDLRIAVREVVNDGGRIATTNDAGGDLSLSATHLSNVGGTLSSDRDLTLVLPGSYTNAELLHAGRDLRITLGGHLENTGTLEANGTLRADVASLGNTTGAHIQAGSVELHATGAIDNRGEITGDVVRVTADSVSNTGVGAITGGDVTLSTRRIENEGSAALVGATGNLALWAADSLRNTAGATLYSAGSLQIAANDVRDADGNFANLTGTVLNSAATIEAQDRIDMAAASLRNERPGVQVAQRAVQSLDERHTLAMPSWWRNADGNNFSYNPNATNYVPYEVYYVSPSDIVERNILVTPDGFQIERVVIRTHANDTVFFSGRAGRSGAYGHRERLSATEGTMVLYAIRAQDGVANPDQVADVASGVWEGEQFVTRWDAAAPAFDAAYGNCTTDCVRFVTQPGYTDPTAIMIRDTQEARGPSTRFSELARDAHTVAYDDALLPGAGEPGRIVAGGDIRIGFTNGLVNSYSDILAGGRVDIAGPETAVDNVATTLYRHYQFDGERIYADGVRQAYTRPELSVAIGSVSGTISGAKGVAIVAKDVRNVDTSAGSAANIVGEVRLASGGTPQGGGTIENAGGQGLGNATGLVAQTAVGTTAQAAGAVGGIHAVAATPGHAVPVLAGGLYTLRPEPGGSYLYETRPAFANYREWLSSDYLVKAMGLDPNNLQKRLGDGFYEQKLVREQVAALTGRRYLDGYASDDAQYAALMTAGSTFAQQYGLRPGIALTAEQMAALTSDIVWLQTQTVSLPDGSTQDVLVPKVYVAQAGAHALKPSGALITGDDIRIEAGQVVNRGGSIGDANTKRAVLIASADIVNQGGTIQADAVGLKAGGSIFNETLAKTQTYGQDDAQVKASGSIASLSNTARIVARDELVIDAGRDVVDTAGKISAGGTASVTAKRDIHFNTLATGSNYQAQLGASSMTREATQANVGQIDAGGNLDLHAGRDLKLDGTQASAGGNADLSAGRHLTLDAATSSQSSDQRSDPAGTQYRQTRSETTVQGASVKAGGNLIAVAGKNEKGDLSVIGGQLDAGDTAVLRASNDIAVTSARQSSNLEDYTHSSTSGFLSKKSSTDHQTNMRDVTVGSSIAGKNVLLSAENDVIVAGAYIGAQEQLALSGGRDVKIQSAEDRYSQSSLHAESKSGFSASLATGLSYGKNASNQMQAGQSTVQVGSVLSGGNVSIDSGRDTQVIASAIVADHNVAVSAGRNIDILQGTDIESVTNASQSSGKSVGLVSGLAPRQTMYGSLKASENGTGESHTAVTSLISANGGNLTMVAGLDPQYKGTGQGNITTEGADLLAQNKVALSGNAVNLDAAASSGDSSYHADSRSVTVGAQLTGVVGGQITRAYDMAQASKSTADSRLKGAQELKAGYDAYKLATSGALGAGIADAGAAGTNGDPSGSAFGVSVSISSSKSRQDIAESFTNQRGTNIQADSIDITARETDINASGAKLQARDITLDAQRDINLGAAVNTAETRGSNSGSSLGFGVTAGFGSQNGISFQLSAGRSNGTANGTEVRYDNTLVSGTDTLTIRSGGDTNLIGAQLTADEVKASISGNLTIQSLQDRTEYESKQSSSGVDVSICVPPICYGQLVTANANYAKQSVDHNYQSATGQSGIAAGSGGFDITVKGNTDLKGAAVTSTAPIDKNSFTTGSLTTSDLTNRQNTDTRSESLSVSYGSNWSSAAANAATSVTNTALGNLNSGKALPTDKAETSQTLSVISPSNVKITGTGNAEVDAKSAENVATLTARDATTANGALVNNLTLQQAQDIPRQQQEAADRQRAAQLVGSVIDNVVGDVSAKNGWAEGGAAKIALHGLAGIVQAKIGDGSVAAGAAVGMLNEALLPVMVDYLESQGIHRYNPNGTPNVEFNELLTAGSTLFGAGVGALGGNAGLGAVVANNATVNNRLLHEDEKAKIKQLANGDPVLEQQLNDAACFMVQCSAGKAVADPAKAAAQTTEQAVASNENGEYDRALMLLKNAQTAELFNYTQADQRLDALDALNAIDPRNAGGLNAQEKSAKDQNIQACRGATGCIDDVNRRYDRMVSDRAETVMTTINVINAYSQCAGGDTSCVAESLVQMKALQANLKTKGVKLEDSERIGLNSYIASAEAALGNGYGALSAAAMGAGGARANEAGNAGAKNWANGGVTAIDVAVATGSPITTRFVNGVTVVDQRTGAIFNGTVDLQPTFDRIAAGATGLSRNDGTAFKNLPDRTTGQILLPAKPPGYYTEYVVPTPGISGPGPQRIVTGQNGEMFYTPDHYLTFIPVKKP